jgi:hypothetical protein
VFSNYSQFSLTDGGTHLPSPNLFTGNLSCLPFFLSHFSHLPNYKSPISPHYLAPNSSRDVPNLYRGSLTLSTQFWPKRTNVIIIILFLSPCGHTLKNMVLNTKPFRVLYNLNNPKIYIHITFEAT